MTENVLGKRRAPDNEPESAVEEGVKTIAPLYFDSVAPDIVHNIVRCISDHAKLQLSDCDGALGEEIPCSIKSLYASIISGSRARKSMFARGEKLINVVLAFGQCFLSESRKLIRMCSSLRSLTLDATCMDHSVNVSFDLLFASCGKVLEELKLKDGCYELGSSITPLIVRHCRVLNTLSLQRTQFGSSLSVLFQGVGPKLRKLSVMNFGDKNLDDLAQYCPLLEDVRLDGHQMSFAMKLQSPLKVIRFISYPSIGGLKKLVEQVPNVHLRLRVLPRKDCTRDLLRFSAAQLEYLCFHENDVKFADFENIVPLLVKLKDFEITAKRESDDGIKLFFDAFYARPKLNLRKLRISGVSCSSTFDYLASKVSTLREFTCVYYGTKALNDTELCAFLSANRELALVRIRYTEPFCNKDLNITETSNIGRTASLLKGLKRFCSLRRFELDIHYSSTTYSIPSKTIADACVGLRGKGIRVEVGRVLYLD